jgi:putative membrane protein insertion efficiency factor
MSRNHKIIEVNGNKYHCNVAPNQIPMIERLLRGTTDSDEAIQALKIPSRPFWLRGAVKFLRWYRRIITPHLGSRCVFEPSCSHYAELALREKGLIKGLWLTMKRLYRCRQGAGGIDMP